MVLELKDFKHYLIVLAIDVILRVITFILSLANFSLGTKVIPTSTVVVEANELIMVMITQKVKIVMMDVMVNIRVL